MTSCQAVFVADLNDQLKYPDRMDGSNIQCDQMGNYERRQCVSYTDYCDCVVPETGNRIPGLANVGESADCLRKCVHSGRWRRVFISRGFL